MRDPRRIETILKALREVWESEPDLRLGQLLIDAARPSSPCPEIFNIEDDELLEGLHRYQRLQSSRVRIEDLPLRCPCCGYKTLGERAGFEICPVCFWEDDGQDDHDADKVRGGPNGVLSLTQARANYLAFGASNESDLPHVRAPHADEL